MSNQDITFMRLVRKLHAAELQHLRGLVAEQQGLIEAQAQQIERLQREASWAEDRAEMFHDALNSAMGKLPEAHLTLTPNGQLGVSVQ